MVSSRLGRHYLVRGLDARVDGRDGLGLLIVRADQMIRVWGAMFFFPPCKLFSLLTRNKPFFPTRQRKKQLFFPI